MELVICAQPLDATPTLERIDDPLAVAEARRLAARAREDAWVRLWEGFDRLAALDARQRALINARPAAAAERLVAIASDPRRPPPTRSLAIHELLEMGDPRGWAAAAEALREMAPEAARELLDELSFWRSGYRVDAPPEVLSILDRLAESADAGLRLAAVRARLELEGEPQRRPWMERLAGEGREAAAAILEALADHRFDADLGERILDHLAAAAGGLHVAEMRLLRRCLGPGASELVQALAAAILGSCLEADVAGGAAPRQQDLLLLAEHAGPAQRELVARLFAGRTDPVVRGACLRALARLDGESFSGALRQRYLLDHELSGAAAAALGAIAAGSGDAAVVEEIEAAAAVARYGVEPHVAAILKVGGAAAEEAARRLARRLEPASRLSLFARLAGLDIERASEGFVACGIVTAEAAAEALAATRGRGLPDRFDLLVLAFLEEAGCLVWFDTEADQIPPPHDALLGRFAAASRGGFRPEAILQLPAGGSEGACTLQFVHGECLYRVHCEDMHDFYDHDAVVVAANAALEACGRAERFVEVVAYGQDAALLYAEPSSAVAAAGEGLLAFRMAPPPADGGPDGEAADADEIAERARLLREAAQRWLESWPEEAPRRESESPASGVGPN